MNAFREAGFELAGPAFTLIADGVAHRPEAMERDGEEWRLDGVRIRLREERTADGSWSVVLEADGVDRVEEVCLLDHQVTPKPAQIVDYAWFDDWDLQQSTALFVRGDGSGFFACVANPFGRARVLWNRVRLWYRPGISAGGSFVSDPFVFGAYRLEGREIRREVVPGRDTVCGRESSYVRTLGRTRTALDAAEVRAVREAVRARVPWEPARMQVSHWDWGENLYRLDPATGEGRAAYARLTELCERIGVETLLLCPGSRFSEHPVLEEEARESGPWQHAMWLGMGNEVGRGEWRPGAEPAGVKEVVADARGRGLRVAAYTNPQYLWLRDPEWQVVHQAGEELDEGYRIACLAHEPARAFLVERLREFLPEYGVGGVALDFVFWRPCHATHHGHAPGEDSRYAQWDGYRQVVRALREAGIEWVEGLMASQEQMPWGSLGLTHPCPSMGDNQPQWAPAWPDLSLHRALGNFQRRVAYWYRNYAFLPTAKVPSQVSHQANRLRYAPVERGWDWAGARYNLLSAIASAPSTVSFCFLPCWDEREWAATLERDGEFFARWLGFARDHAELLSRLDDLWGEPEPGKVDGTAAVGEDGNGFVFLANPDFEPHTVAVPRLPAGRMLRELHPEEGRLWEPGAVGVEPHEIGVYELVPAGSGPAAALAAPRDGVQSTLGPWREEGGRLVADWTPGAALPGLLATLAPPLAPEGHELLQPWSDPSRLRLFVELVDPQAARVRVWVDGQEVEVAQAYVGTFPDVKDAERLGLENNLLGHHLDVHDRLLACDDLERPWRVELELDGVAPGRFRGVHVAELPRRA
ncbi:MAG TPA: hypothetical protein VFJ91_07700 [Gaiellaceae bacterium]|nr:hypothetical protein [Gaiellaceae bacterium]